MPNKKKNSKKFTISKTNLKSKVNFKKNNINFENLKRFSKHQRKTNKEIDLNRT